MRKRREIEVDIYCSDKVEMRQITNDQNVNLNFPRCTVSDVAPLSCMSCVWRVSVACQAVPVACLSRGCRVSVSDISLYRLHLISLVIIYFQSREWVALKTLLAEPSQYWKAKVNFWEETTSDESSPFVDVPWSPSIAATKYFLFKTVASVFQDRVLNIPLQSTADQTDVDMVKEDRGRMMSTEYQVLFQACFVEFLYKRQSQVLKDG